jgi:hypothetical protein
MEDLILRLSAGQCFAEDNHISVNVKVVVL